MGSLGGKDTWKLIVQGHEVQLCLVKHKNSMPLCSIKSGHLVQEYKSVFWDKSGFFFVIAIFTNLSAIFPMSCLVKKNDKTEKENGQIPYWNVLFVLTSGPKKQRLFIHYYRQQHLKSWS